jgi:hypothetical protein
VTVARRKDAVVERDGHGDIQAELRFHTSTSILPALVGISFVRREHGVEATYFAPQRCLQIPVAYSVAALAAFFQIRA